jgi:hypothetical protein
LAAREPLLGRLPCVAFRGATNCSTLRSVSSLACSGCGAPVALPSDLTAQEAVCPFCPMRTALPADLLAVRLREHKELFAEQQQAAIQAQVGATVRKTTKFVMWIVIVSVALPIVLTAGIMIVVAIVSSHAAHDMAPHGATPRATHGH